MTQETDADVDRSTDTKVSRRDLLRAGGATAGVVAAGGIPTATGIEQPVGDADALAVTTGVALAAGLTGLGVGFAGGAAVEEMFGTSVDTAEVEADARKQQNYNVVTSSGQTLVSQVTDHKESAGLIEKNTTKTDPNRYQLEKPNDNPVAHTATEHGTSAVVEAYKKGKPQSEAVKDYQNAVDVVATTSMWSVIGSWNNFVRGVASAVILDAGNGWGLINHPKYDRDGDVITGGGNDSRTGFYGVSTANGVPIGQKTYLKAVGGTSISGGWSPIQVRNITDYLPASPDIIPDKKIPDGGFKILELYTAEYYLDWDHNIRWTTITPFTDGYKEIGLESSKSDKFHNRSDGTDSNHSALEPRYMTAKYPKTDDTTTIPLQVFPAAVNAIEKIRDNVTVEAPTVVDKIYGGLQSGKITEKDVMSSRQYYQQNDISGNYNRAIVALNSYGNLDMPQGANSVTIEADGMELTGMLFVDVAAGEELNLKAGDTLKGNEYESAQMLTSSDSQTYRFEEADISIKSVKGTDTLSFKSRERTGPDNVDVEKLNNQMKQLQERNEQLDKQLDKLEGGGGDGSNLFGGATLPSVEDNLALYGVGAAVAAYLLGGN